MASKINERPIFVFMDTLPTVFECVRCIESVASIGNKTQVQKQAIHEFSLQLGELWSKAFSEEHVTVKSNIMRKLEKHLSDYARKVYKKKGNKRANLKAWKLANSHLFDILKSTSNPEEFEPDEKQFYHDQKSGSRAMAISDKVDEEYEARKASEQSGTVPLDDEEDDDNDVVQGGSEINVNDPMLTQSSLRTGKFRTTKQLVDKNTQTDAPAEYKTPIRQKRNFTSDVKSAIATTSSKAGITVEQARRAFQSVCEIFCKSKYYLTADEVPQVSDTEGPLHDKPKRPRAKHSLSFDNETPKHPRSSKDYEKYENVLPSARVVNREKHLQAIQEERNCALAIMDAEPEDDISVHYDTTQRRKIQGDWTSLIMKLSNGQSFRLRPLSLAVEDRQTITDLFVEQFKRLAVAGNSSARDLWEKVTALMTDSVAKNLHIEDSIAATLNSTHIPFHLLCVSHTCEVFDKGAIQVLKEAEILLGLREALIARMPALKSFLSGDKCITVAALEALNKVVRNDGHTSSHWELFEKILADKNKTKKHSHYKERRFAKLGYTAATILHHIEDYEELLKLTKSNNQLIQACRVYLEQCEFIVIGLKVLAWFTYKVTLPFLNMVEISTQSDLLTILPQLYQDLSTKSLDTLSKYEVDYSFKVSEPTSLVEKHVLGLVCTKAASNLATQRGREYGFGPQLNVSGRATALHTLDPSKLQFLPTDNLDCERDLAIFDKLAARSASCANHKFTAKGIRDEMTLLKCSQVTVEKVTKSLVKTLDARERQWVDKQDLLKKAKLEKSCNAGVRAIEYVHVLLQKCKSWGGPFTCIDELESCVDESDDDERLKTILRTEVAYRKHTSPHDQRTRPMLYKLNQVSLAELKINLTLILTSDSETLGDNIPSFPTEEDMEQAFKLHVDEQANPNTISIEEKKKEVQNKDPEVHINEPCIVLWDINEKRQWYVGICLADHEDGTFTVEHLERCSKTGDSKLWKHPYHSDIQTVSILQIIPCNIIGSWDLRKRIMTFVLENSEMIDILFRSFY